MAITALHAEPWLIDVPGAARRGGGGGRGECDGAGVRIIGMRGMTSWGGGVQPEEQVVKSG